MNKRQKERRTLTEHELKIKIGKFFILSHFGILALVISLHFIPIAKGFLFDEMTTTVYLLIPMFAVYTLAIVRDFIANKNAVEPEKKPITAEYAFITKLVTWFFVCFIVIMIVLRALNVIGNFEHFKLMIVLSETIFGVFISAILGSMFDIQKAKAELERHTAAQKSEQNIDSP